MLAKLPKSKWLLFLGLPLLFLSCDKFESGIYAVSDTGYSDLNNKSIAKLTNTNTDTIRIAVIGDTQRFYGQSEDIVEHINEYDDLDFAVHTGDLVDFGVQREYVWMHEVLKELTIPYIAVVGNHDIIGNGDEIYANMYGSSDFSFMVGSNKFVYINTNSREFDNNLTVPNISWLDKQLADTANYEQAIVVCHVPFDNVDFDPELVDPFMETLTKYGKTVMSINGHNHSYNLFTIDGIVYLNSASSSKDQFVIATIWDGGMDIELVE